MQVQEKHLNLSERTANVVAKVAAVKDESSVKTIPP
jgi:hypothetical protein